jgi:DNA-binding GntR family transcriptional regulator
MENGNSTMPIPEKTAPLKQLSAKERIYSKLCDWIINGTLESGEKMLDNDIAKYFNVSRTPVREALQMLSDLGFVRIVPNRGTFVSPISESESYKVYSLLAVLHGEAMRQGFEALDAAAVSGLEKYNGMMKKALENKNPGACIDADSLFHNIIIDAADNKFLSDCIVKLRLNILRVEYLEYSNSTWRAASTEDHDRIIAALKKHDKEAAIAALYENWMNFGERYSND